MEWSVLTVALVFGLAVVAYVAGNVVVRLVDNLLDKLGW